MELKTYFVQDSAGNVLIGALCSLYVQGTTTLVTGLLGANGSPLDNPMTSSGNGQIQFKCANGTYDLKVVKGVLNYTLTIQCSDVNESVAAAQAAAANAAAEFSSIFTADQVARGNLFATEQSTRTDAFNTSQTTRDTQFNTSQSGRTDTFNNSQTTRDTQFSTSQSGRTDSFTAEQSTRTGQFIDFLKKSAYETPVDYASGISITRPTQQVRYLTDLYRPLDSAIPFTTTTFAADTAKWVSNGQAALSQRIFGSNVQLVGAGDSIMAGTTSPNTISIPQALQQYYAPLSLSTLSNTAVPGSRLDSSIGGTAAAADMVARYAANVYPKRPAATGSSSSILLLSIGANDFNTLSDANVSVWCARLDTYCAQARTDGFTVVMMTIMKRTNTNDNTVVNNRRRLIMNDFIRRSKNIDVYIDSDQLIPDTSDTSLIIDGTHPNDTGNRLLGRAFASSISALGVVVPAAVLPSASLEPVVGSSENAVLYRTALTATANGTNTMSTKNPAAIGTGDFTLSWWSNIPLANITSNNNVFSDAQTPEHSFGVIGGSNGLGRMYILPGASSVWSSTAIFPDVWNHCAIVRSGTTITYYLNGAALNSVTYADSVPTLRNFLRGANGLFSRLRAYTRAFSATEVKTQFIRLSEFDNDSTCIYALEDGSKCSGRHLLDLSVSKADIQIVDPTKLAITQPSRSGVVRVTTVGAGTPWGAPAGSRITSWTANVTVVGTGSVNLSDANNTGKFFNSALTSGITDLTLLSRYPTVSGQIFCNATGYTIDHTITWDSM